MSQQENLTATQEVRTARRGRKPKAAAEKEGKAADSAKKASEPGKEESVPGRAAAEKPAKKRAAAKKPEEQAAEKPAPKRRGRPPKAKAADTATQTAVPTEAQTAAQTAVQTEKREPEENGARAGETAVREPESSVSGAEGGEKADEQKVQREATAQDDAEVRPYRRPGTYFVKNGPLRLSPQERSMRPGRGGSASSRERGKPGLQGWRAQGSMRARSARRRRIRVFLLRQASCSEAAIAAIAAEFLI